MALTNGKITLSHAAAPLGRVLNLNPAIGREQQRREDAKKKLENGEFGDGLGSPAK
jgi:hypothetical protein